MTKTVNSFLQLPAFQCCLYLHIIKFLIIFINKTLKNEIFLNNTCFIVVYQLHSSGRSNS